MTLLFLHRVPVPGMETHIPVLFLDLSGMLFLAVFCVRNLAKHSPPLITVELSFCLFFFAPADDFQASLSAPLAGGLDALLEGEDDDDDFFDLHIVKHYDPEVRRHAPLEILMQDVDLFQSFLCKSQM